MAIEANTPNDWGMRGATNTTLSQFQGVPRQLVVNIEDGYRPVIMDGSTLGGKFKCASSDELNSGLATKLGKSEKAASATVADSANSVAGANVTGTVANATKATQDSNGNIFTEFYATKIENDKKISLEGFRGYLAGYESIGYNTTINQDSNDASEVGENLIVENGVASTSWTKIVRLTSAITISLGDNWHWQNGEIPTITPNGILVLCWCGSGGLASFNSATA